MQNNLCSCERFLQHPGLTHIQNFNISTSVVSSNGCQIIYIGIFFPISPSENKDNLFGQLLLIVLMNVLMLLVNVFSNVKLLIPMRLAIM